METKTKIILIVVCVVIALLIIWSVLSYFSEGKRKGRAAERNGGTVQSKMSGKWSITGQRFTRCNRKIFRGLTSLKNIHTRLSMCNKKAGREKVRKCD